MPQRRFLHLVLTSMVLLPACLLVLSCAPGIDSGMEPRLSLVIGDDPSLQSPVPVNPYDTVTVDQHGGYFWLRLQFDDWPFRGDCWLTLLRANAAIEVYVDGIRVDSIGRMPPSCFIDSGRTALVRIAAGTMPAGTAPEIRLRMYSDGGTSRLPFIQITGDQALADWYRFVNFFNSDVYRYLAALSVFICLFFIVQYQQRPGENTNLFFALFNLFIAVYYLGLGNALASIPVPVTPGLTRGCLFLAISAMVMFCLSFVRHPSRRLMIAAAGTGVFIFLVLLIVPQNLAESRNLFNLALIPGMIMLVAAVVYLFRLYLDGNLELKPLLLGGVVALAFGLFDTVIVMAGLKPLVWLQGYGIFVFLLAVFMTIVNRTTRMHAELAGYTKGIEAEVERRTRELHESNTALLKANAAKSDFLAHMSHEIRTPLNCIMGFTQMLEQRIENPEDRRNIALILQESDHLMQLITHILDFSRIEKGKLILENQPFGLKAAITAVVEGLSPSAGAKKLRLDCEFNPDVPPRVRGDCLRFQQILINLLGNAIKFTESGYVRLEIKAHPTSGSQETELCIRICDSGIGIPSDRLEAIFNSFEQADTSITRRFGGSGLGLTIARDLIRLMGGQIRITSQLGSGTVIDFSVLLGMAEDLPATVPERVADNSKGHFGFARTVLVVDDYQANREVLCLFLKTAGLISLEAASGAEAIEQTRLHGREISAVFMDIHMPDMDGFEATRRLRELDSSLMIPVIALTADAFAETDRHCRQAGMQEVLTKPIRYPDLLACLKRVIPQTVKSGPSQGEAIVSVSSENPGQTTGAIGHPAPLDMAALREVFFDDAEAINNLIDSFIVSGNAIMPLLRDGVDKRDADLVHLKAHALKGGALNINATDLVSAAARLEKSARDNHPEAFLEQFAEVEREWRVIREWWTTRY